MSKIYCCEFSDNQIECKRVFQEESEEDANKYSQRRAGGMSAKMQLKVIREGQKLYQFVVFTEKENKGYVNIKSNKVLSLKRNNISESLKSALPKEAIEFLSSVTGINFDSEESEEFDDKKQESFLKKMLFLIGVL